MGLKIPALGTYKREKSRTTDLDGVVTEKKKSELSLGGDLYKSKQESETSGQGALADYKHTSETQVGGKVDSYEQSRTVENGSVTRKFEEQHSKSGGRTMTDQDGVVTVDEIKDRLERETGFDLILAIDEHEIEGEELKEGIKKIREGIEHLSETIKDIRKLFDMVPQIGWKFSFDVAVMAGSILVECVPEYVDGPRANGRYLAVQHKFHGKIEVKVFDITIECSFGVDAHAVGTGLTLKVQGTLGVKAEIKKEINLDFWKPKQEFEIEGKSKLEFAVVGYVDVFGKTLADGKFGVTTGLDFKHGKLEADLAERKFHLEGTLATRDLLLFGYIRVPLWWDKKIDPPKKLLHGRPLCHVG
jgi:hypothetical protein